MYKTVHTWTGIVAGMALFIAFYAGALTIFKDPIVQWASAPVPAEVKTYSSLDDAPALISQTLLQQPSAAKGFSLQLPEENDQGIALNWRIAPEDADMHDEVAGQRFSAWLAAGGDGVTVAQNQPSAVGEVIDVLHSVIGLPVDTESNRLIMGVVVMLYTLALISGLVMMLPTLVRDLFALRLKANLKRMWMDAHNVVGVVSLPFHLIIALTAAGFAFHDPIYEIQKELVHDGQSFAMGRSSAPPRDSYDPAEMLPPEQLLSKITALSENFEPRSLEYFRVTGPMPMVRVWGDDKSTFSIGTEGAFAMMDPYTGEVIGTDFLPGQQPTSMLTVSSLFSAHFGSYGGLGVQWSYFFLGLSGAWLFYSGNLLWIESRRRKQRGAPDAPEQNLATRLMGSATIGVCLGCITGISLTLVSSKWLYGVVDDPASWHLKLYYVMFFAAIGWAFFRGAARAAVELLYCAALFTLAIPLTSLLAVVIPALGWWANGHAAIGVDLMACFIGVCFIQIAKATQKRIHTGAADSLWSTAAFAKSQAVAIQ